MQVVVYMDGEIRVVLVGPKYQVNLGYIARVAKNFGIRQLRVVGPRCKLTGKQARKYSKHAYDLLEGARVFGSISEATRGSGMVIGTTGVWHKGERAFHNVYPPEQARRMASGAGRISLLIGRDDTGLSKDELQACDATVFIPTNDGYPVLNISHALAILLYEFTRGRAAGDYPTGRLRAGEGAISRTVGLFEALARSRDGIRNMRAVTSAFAHILRRSSPTEVELRAIAAALSTRKEKEGKGKWDKK